MLEKLKDRWVRLDLWYLTSGAQEVVNLVGKIVHYTMYVAPPTILMMIGFDKMKEVYGVVHPFSLGLYMIGIWVVSKGAAELVE